MATPRKLPAKKPTSRNDQVVRVLRLLKDLDRVDGADLYELAARYGTTVRTIRRDLAALEQSGLPLHKELVDGTARVRWSLDSDAAERMTRLLDAGHYLALRLAMDESASVRRSQTLFATLEDLAGRIERAIGRTGRQKLLEIDACFFSWEKFVWKNAPRLRGPLPRSQLRQQGAQLHGAAPPPLRPRRHALHARVAAALRGGERVWHPSQ